jgi:glycosyltransferase involved in cell wall biosynthesis
VGYIGIKGLPAQAGVDRVVEAIVGRMPVLGIEPTVFCDQAFTADNYTLGGVKIVRVSSLPGKYFGAPSRFIHSALKAILAYDFDLIHLHNIESGFILPLLRLKYPVLSTAHGFAYWRAKWGSSARRLLRLADWPFVNLSSRVTSVSAIDAENLSSRFRKKIDYIPNGVSTDIQPDKTRAAELLSGIGLTPEHYFIFVAGRIEPTKGAHLAIQAVNKLPKDMPLLVVGDLNQVPAYRIELEQMAGSRVKFHPLITDPRLLFGLIANSICLIFPSLVEAMSMVLLEAASVGAPILASNISANTMVMEDGIEYFESGDAESLAKKLIWVLENGPSMTLKSKMTQERVHRLFNWDAIAARYAAVYTEMLEERNR